MRWWKWRLSGLQKWGCVRSAGPARVEADGRHEDAWRESGGDRAACPSASLRLSLWDVLALSGSLKKNRTQPLRPLPYSMGGGGAERVHNRLLLTTAAAMAGLTVSRLQHPSRRRHHWEALTWADARQRCSARCRSAWYAPVPHLAASPASPAGRRWMVRSGQVQTVRWPA